MSKTIKTEHGDLHMVTNWHERDELHWHDLTDSERERLDYVSESDQEWWTGFRYRGEIYDLGEFEVAPARFKALGFDGWQTQSYFDAVAVCYFDEDGNVLDGVKVAHFHW